MAAAIPAGRRRYRLVRLSLVQEMAMQRTPITPPARPAALGDFLPSGSILLDCVLGGGWRMGRVANIVGDRSSGKTLLAIEACANFAAITDDVSRIRYVEAEAAFDDEYAHILGMPEGLSTISSVQTVEALEDDLIEFLGQQKDRAGCLYVVDSLDALSDDNEMKLERGDASYGAAKAKALSEMFRKRIRQIEDANCLMFIISQLRDNIGVRFGETKKRSGGRALDYYATQILWLTELKKLKRTIRGAERVIGIEVGARTKKNKVGPPFRDCEFTLQFGYGVDDETTMLKWLIDHKALDAVTEFPGEDIGKLIPKLRAAGDRPKLRKIHAALSAAVRARWAEIEDALQPPMKKYDRAE